MSRLIRAGIKLANQKVAQSFAVDGSTLYALQVSTGGERAGHLTVSRIDMNTWKLTGRMHLKGFGHGVAMGVEPGGFLWVECGPVVTVEGSARGTRITRVRFKNGAKVVGHGDVVLKPPGPRCSPSIDGDRLALRWWDGKRYRYGVYSLPAAREGRLEAITPANPTLGLHGVFQGHQIVAESIVCSVGQKGQPVSLGVIDLASGKTSVIRTGIKTSGYFEPEGVSLVNNQVWFGAAVGGIGRRRFNIYVKE